MDQEAGDQEAGDQEAVDQAAVDQEAGTKRQAVLGYKDGSCGQIKSWDIIQSDGWDMSSDQELRYEDKLKWDKRSRASI